MPGRSDWRARLAGFLQAQQKTIARTQQTPLVSVDFQIRKLLSVLRERSIRAVLAGETYCVQRRLQRGLSPAARKRPCQAG